MENRKETIQEIMACLHAMKNKMHFKHFKINPKDRITHSQWFVMHLIEGNRNIGIKDISNMLHITASAASQLVDGLLESGYVVQKSDASDHRFLQINLSTKGRKMIVQMRKQGVELMGKLFDTLSDEELKQYLALHKKILNNIQPK
jgi:DNA-binding MarR family transcriptional regulator